MAGRLAFDPISVRTHSSESQGRMRNYRPAFESIVLGRSTDNLDREMVRSLQAIIGAAYLKADEKGVGGQVREIFSDFARNIDNNIVKLASQRIAEAVKGVSAEHLPDFLSAMHREMLRCPDRADAIPEAMLNTYQLAGGRVGADAIIRAVRIGFARSRTMCPKEVSNTIKCEYESGRLDHIGEISALRNEPQAQGGAQLTYTVTSLPAGNESMPVPEALPIAHFVSPKTPDELKEGVSYLQEVPQIVATRHREEIRERRNASKAEKSLPAAKPKAAPAETGKPMIVRARQHAAQFQIGAAPQKMERPRRTQAKAEEAAQENAPVELPRQRTDRKMPARPREIRIKPGPAPEIRTERKRIRREIPREISVRKIVRLARPLTAAAASRERARRAIPLPRFGTARRERREGMLAKPVKAKAAKKKPSTPKARENAARKKARPIKPASEARAQRPLTGKKEREKRGAKTEARKKRERGIRSPAPEMKVKLKSAPKLDARGLMCSLRLRKGIHRAPTCQPRPHISRMLSRIREKMRRRSPGEIIFKLGF